MKFLLAFEIVATLSLLVTCVAAQGHDEWLPVSNFKSSASTSSATETGVAASDTSTVSTSAVKPYSGLDAVKCCAGASAGPDGISSSSLTLTYGDYGAQGVNVEPTSMAVSSISAANLRTTTPHSRDGLPKMTHLVAASTHNASVPMPTSLSMPKSVLHPQSSKSSSCQPDTPRAILAMYDCPLTPLTPLAPTTPQTPSSLPAANGSTTSISCRPDTPRAVLAMYDCPLTPEDTTRTAPKIPPTVTSPVNTPAPFWSTFSPITTALPAISPTAKQLSVTNSSQQLATCTGRPTINSNHPANSNKRLMSRRAAEPHYRGFNVVNQSPASPAKFKNTAEWADAFRRIRGFPGDYNAARLYSTTDGETKHLLNALPAARSQNIKLFAGVWSGGDAYQGRFAAEKAALDEALTQFGCDDIIAVSVGNEDMYSNHRTDGGQTPLTDVMLLVNQTQEVMEMLDTHGCCDVKVTHTDTFGDWLKTNVSEPLIRQVDFLTVNIFPYWEGQHIDTAGQVFWQQVNETKEMAAKYGKDIWVGETGWPLRGDRVGDADTGPTLLHAYWNQVGCHLMNNMSAFWYVEWDANTIPSFGMMDADGRVMIGIGECP